MSATQRNNYGEAEATQGRVARSQRLWPASQRERGGESPYHRGAILRSRPAGLRTASRQAYIQRWGGMLAVAAQRALAASLLELPPKGVPGTDLPVPELSEVPDDARWKFSPAVSRSSGPG